MPPPNSSFLWDDFAYNGPVILALHLGMVICTAIAVFISIRRPRTVVAFAFSISPFVLGAFAFWLGIVRFTANFPRIFDGFYEGDPVQSLQLAQRPFFIGIGLSFLALVAYFLCRAPIRVTQSDETLAETDD